MTADEVKAVRSKLGLTQHELARKLNVTVVCISYWECGRRKPSRKMEKKLMRLFARAG